MIVREPQTHTTTVNAIVDIRCNKCGHSMAIDDRGGGILPDRGVGRQYLGLLRGSVDGCYASEELVDTHRYHFSLCEKCLVDLFHSFTIPPTVAEYCIGTDEATQRDLTWEDDRRIQTVSRDHATPVERWECACSDPIWVTVGKVGIYWHRNGMFAHMETEPDGQFVYRLECMNIAGRAHTEDEAWEQLHESFQRELTAAFKTGTLNQYLRAPHWRVTRTQENGQP